METLVCIMRCAIYTLAFVGIVYSVICEYHKYEQQKRDDERNDLRAEWMKKNSREYLAHEEEFARYCLMREAQKIKF